MKFKAVYIVGIQALLFLLFLLITSYFNRFSADDFHFIGELKSSSFKGIYTHLYSDWHGRWTSNLLIYLLKFSATPLFLMSFNLLSFGLLYSGILQLLKVMNSNYQLSLNRLSRFIYTGVFISILFFCTVSPDDSWFWFTSSIVYFFSTIAFFWALTIYLKKRNTILDYIIYTLCLTYIGGSNEPLTFFIILSLLFLIFKRIKTSTAILGVILIGSSFLINYLSSGTVYRDNITPSLSFVDVILYSVYGTLKLLFFSIYKTFIPALILAYPFYLLGKKQTTPINMFNPIASLWKSLGLIIAVILLNQLIVVYALGSLPPDRSTISSSIVTSIILIRYLFLLGNYHREKYKPLNPILIFSVVGLICFNGYFGYLHYQYAQAVDLRIDHISSCNNELIVVYPLPESGYLHSAEITTDTKHHTNKHLKKGVGLNKDIILGQD